MPCTEQEIYSQVEMLVDAVASLHFLTIDDETDEMHQAAAQLVADEQATLIAMIGELFTKEPANEKS